MTIRVHPGPKLLKLVAAGLVLCALFNFDYPAQRIAPSGLLLPSADVWLLLVVLALAAACGRRPLFWTTPAVWALFLGLRLLRIGDTAAAMFLNRPVNLYIDSGYLFGLYDLIKTSSHPGDFARIAAIALMAAAIILVASGYAWRAAAGVLSDRMARIWFLSASGLVLLCGWIWGWHGVKPPTLIRLGQEILWIQKHTGQRQAFAARLEKTAADRAGHPASLNGLQGADVLLFLVESYGSTVLRRPSYQAGMQATLAGFGTVLEQHGFSAVSGFLESPTFGGSSWLAHATLASGVRVRDDLEYAALLRSCLPPLASYFRASGYRTVSVMPGIRFAFPEGAWFGYEQVYYASHFNYGGPAFGWAPMPDQFVLDWVRRREAVRRERPLFACYVLISSHAAFNIQPPFVPDWDRIGDGRIYHDLQPVRYPIQWPDLSNAGEAYLRSLDYEFTVLGDYLARYVRADTLIMVLGDHQPNLQLTEVGETWSVPVHVISRNARLLEPFRRRGYTKGLTPSQEPPHAGMETFVQGFLEDFR